PAAWRTYRLMLPHVLALGFSGFESRAATADDPGWRSLLLDVMHYLVVHADAGTARDLAQAAREHWALGPDAVAAAERLAQAWYRLGDHRRAVALDESVLADRRRLEGPDARGTLQAEHNLAIDRWASGDDRPAATALLEDVARRRTRVLGAQDPDTLRSLHNLALARRAIGAHEEALELDDACRLRFAAILGPDHPDTLRSAVATALDLRALGRHDEALKLEEETYDRLHRTLGPEHPDTLRSAYGLAVGLRLTGSTERARELAEAAHRGRRKVLGDDHVDTLRSAFLLGQLRIECGDSGGATMRADARRRLEMVSTQGVQEGSRVDLDSESLPALPAFLTADSAVGHDVGDATGPDRVERAQDGGDSAFGQGPDAVGPARAESAQGGNDPGPGPELDVAEPSGPAQNSTGPGPGPHPDPGPAAGPSSESAVGREVGGAAGPVP
ncbi:MAG: tetratricopeptide repeat protein, partial [Catenulispora sp.]|nr:tetratricopeptide repeat protein [Catenulispora sp.]